MPDRSAILRTGFFDRIDDGPIGAKPTPVKPFGSPSPYIIF